MKGDYKNAELSARQSIAEDPKEWKAYQYLGVALDAQGKHKSAEETFRKGLEYKDGDPASLMSNLALSVAAQGRWEEALEIIEDAHKLDPTNAEIEKNKEVIKSHI